jgi:hypothetical protein
MAKKSFGTIQLSSKDLPEIKDWKIGDTYEVCVDFTLQGIRKAERYDEMYIGNKMPPEPPKDEVVANFNITAVKIEEPEEEFVDEYTKVRTGKKILGNKSKS